MKLKNSTIKIFFYNLIFVNSKYTQNFFNKWKKDEFFLNLIKIICYIWKSSSKAYYQVIKCF